MKAAAYPCHHSCLSTQQASNCQLHSGVRITLLLLLLSATAAIPASPPQPAPGTCTSTEDALPLDYSIAASVQAFYYLWYGEPDTDGSYIHWNHQILPHWNPEVARHYPAGGSFSPPNNLHCPFYPQLGPYSSSDMAVVLAHMRQLQDVGVTVLVVSWWGPHWREGTHDTQGVQTDLVLPLVVRAAEQLGNVYLAFHLEPYPGRTAGSTREDLEYLQQLYSASPAILRIRGRPVYYVYDSYLTPPQEWAQLLQPNGSLSVRGTEVDGVFLGLWLNSDDGDRLIHPAGFDGFYTYFASEATSFAANPASWLALGQWARQRGLLFVPSVAPGYNDTRIRPWNGAASRSRDYGNRYERYWAAAIAAGADLVSITSFNEWGEGTQIEPASARCDDVTGAIYEDYGVRGPSFYLKLTQFWSQVWRATLQRRLFPQLDSGQQAAAQAHCAASVAAAEDDDDYLD